MTRSLQRGPAPRPPIGPGGLPSHQLVPRPPRGPGGLLRRGATRASATLAAKIKAAIATVKTFIMGSISPCFVPQGFCPRARTAAIGLLGRADLRERGV